MAKRDSSYYLARLQREHPTIWADFRGGLYPSINAALRAAGMRSYRTPLHELRNAWRKASPAERSTFIKWIKAGGKASTGTKVAIDQKLTPHAARRVREIMDRRGLKMGDVMRELGFKALDPSLGQALASGTRIQPTLIQAVEKWLAKNSAI